jgi:hypothetical protein
MWIGATCTRSNKAKYAGSHSHVNVAMPLFVFAIVLLLVGLLEQELS